MSLPGTADRSVLTRRAIQKLPPLLVNQIAAGEVVERPASVVKELVDNAIDAGATRVEVELENGGIDLVRVTDNGGGIPAGELPLAVAPHATSKVREAADLDRIATMGFRGEALASIASVSRMSIRSRTAADAGASCLEIEGDISGEVRPAAGPVGTCVSVRNLFFNTPARRKFVRTPPTEAGHCLDIVETLAMSHPAIGFRFVRDGKCVLDLPAGQSPRERIVAVLGKELEDQLLPVSADGFDDARGLSLWGTIGLPALARGTAKCQFVFLNGRPIRDRGIAHAIKEAYRGIIEPGRFPTVALMLEMSPAAVDVNVHPQKTEVRFRDSSLVHSVVLRSLRDALRAADLTPTLGAAGFGQPSGLGFGGRAVLPLAGAYDASGLEDRLGGEGAAAGGGGAGGEGGAGAPGFVEYFRSIPGLAGADGRLSYEAVRSAVADAGRVPAPPGGDGAEGGPGGGGVDDGAVAMPSAEPAPLASPRPADRVLQVHNSYVVTQDEAGLLIVDQHALHERVMFEELLARVSRGELESQRLLMPAVVPLRGRQGDLLEPLRPLLTRIGVEVEPIGPAEAAVHAFPTFLFERGVEAGPFIEELLAKAEAEGFVPDAEETLREVLDMMACKAAVKAGDRMTESELAALLTLRETVERAAACPHGRPTSVRLTIRQLEKLFHRA